MPPTDWLSWEFWAETARAIWTGYAANRDNIVPIATFLGALTVAWAALKQARTASLRHTEQTKADRERRITESFAKAVEQLGSDKLEIRLGGIYTLERIAQESEREYWPVMETLTAYMHEHAPWPPRSHPFVECQSAAGQRLGESAPAKRPHKFERAQAQPATDIQAILTVLKRRNEAVRKQDQSKRRFLDLSATDLRGAQLQEAHLEFANLQGAQLEFANLWGAHLEGATLWRAKLEEAELRNAHLSGADFQFATLWGARLMNAHLEGANFGNSQLEGAVFWGAHLEGAVFLDAHLGGTDLRANGLTQQQIDSAQGDEMTMLPAGLTRPVWWGRRWTEPVDEPDNPTK